MKQTNKLSVKRRVAIRSFINKMRSEQPDLHRGVQEFAATLRKSGVEIDELVLWERTINLLQDDKRMSALKVSYDKMMATEAEIAKLVRRSRRKKG